MRVWLARFGYTTTRAGGRTHNNARRVPTAEDARRERRGHGERAAGVPSPAATSRSQAEQQHLAAHDAGFRALGALDQP